MPVVVFLKGLAIAVAIVVVFLYVGLGLFNKPEGK